MELAEINKRIDEIDGWFSYSQQAALYEIVKGLRPRSLIMEIGTYRGKSTLFYTLANPEVIVITNDICNYPWTTKLDPAGFELKNKPIDERVLHAGNVMQIIGRSSEIVKTWNLPIDFLFIDGKHSYDEVKQDINDWGKFVVKGGYIVFHDYDVAHQEVMDGCADYIKDLEIIEINFNLGIFRK